MKLYSDENTSVSFSELLLKRRLFLIFFVGCGTICVFILSFIMPQTFGSTSSLMPPEQRSSGGLSSLLQSAAPGLSLPFGDAKNQSVSADIILSNSLAERIIKQLRLDKHPAYSQIDSQMLIRMVRNSLDVEVKRASGVAYIHCSASTGWLPSRQEIQETKKLASDITNSAVSCLDVMLREKNVSTARKTREFIERVIAVKATERDSIYNAIEQFQKENKIVGLEEQTKAIVTSAVDIGVQLAKMKVELQLARQLYQPGSEIIKQYEQQFETLSAQYDQTQSGGLTASDKFSIPLDKVPALTKRYLNLQRDLKVSEQVNAYLQTQKLQESIQEARDVPVIQVLDTAPIPFERESPKRVIMTMLAAVLFSGLATLWIITSEMYRRRS